MKETNALTRNHNKSSGIKLFNKTVHCILDLLLTKKKEKFTGIFVTATDV